MTARRNALAALLFPFALAGCGRTIPGHPVPAVTPQSTATPASATHPSTSQPDTKLAAINPCELLSAEEVTQLGLPQAEVSPFTNPASCVWATPTANLGITLHPQHGLIDLKTTDAVQVSVRTIGRHEVRVVEYADHCDLDIAIGERSAITISAMIDFPGHATGRQSCGRATQATVLVEPQIPKT